MQALRDLWYTEFLWNPVGQWVIALTLFLVTFTLLPLLRGYISQQRRKWAESGADLPTPIEVIALLVSRTSKLFLFTLAVLLASTQVELPEHVGRIERIAIV